MFQNNVIYVVIPPKVSRIEKRTKVVLLCSRVATVEDDVVKAVSRIVQKKIKDDRSVIYQALGPSDVDIMRTEVLQSYWLAYQSDPQAFAGISCFKKGMEARVYADKIWEESVESAGEPQAQEWGNGLKSTIFEKCPQYSTKELGDYRSLASTPMPFHNNDSAILADGEGGVKEKFEELLSVYCQSSQFSDPNSLYCAIETAINDFLASKASKEVYPRNIEDEVQREICRRYLLMEVTLFYFLVRDYRAVLYPGVHTGIMKWAAIYHGKRLFSDSFKIEEFWCPKQELIPHGWCESVRSNLISLSKQSKIVIGLGPDSVFPKEIMEVVLPVIMNYRRFIEAYYGLGMIELEAINQLSQLKRDLQPDEVIKVLRLCDNLSSIPGIGNPSISISKLGLSEAASASEPQVTTKEVSTREASTQAAVLISYNKPPSSLSSVSARRNSLPVGGTSSLFLYPNQGPASCESTVPSP